MKVCRLAMTNVTVTDSDSEIQESLEPRTTQESCYPGIELLNLSVSFYTCMRFPLYEESVSYLTNLSMLTVANRSQCSDGEIKDSIVNKSDPSTHVRLCAPSSYVART